MSALWMGQSKVSGKRRPFCTPCCRSRGCLGVRKKIRRGNSRRNGSWCVDEVGKVGDDLPLHSTTTIMRGNRKGPNSNLKDVDLTKGVRNPYEAGLVYLLMWAHCRNQTSCGFSNPRISLMVKSPVACKAALVKIILDQPPALAIRT
jgi:hypothetical protein